MATPYWLDLEPITPESVVEESETDSASDFEDSGIFSGNEDDQKSPLVQYYDPTRGDHSYTVVKECDGDGKLPDSGGEDFRLGDDERYPTSATQEISDSDGWTSRSNTSHKSVTVPENSSKGPGAVFRSSATYFTSLARSIWSSNPLCWDTKSYSLLNNPSPAAAAEKPSFTSFRPWLSEGPKKTIDQPIIPKIDIEPELPTIPLPDIPKKRVFSTLDTASILRQSTDIFLNQHSSKYLQTSLVRPPPKSEIFESAKTSRSESKRSRGLRLVQNDIRKARAPRKQPHPTRSPKRHDPNFRGVMVKFRLKFLRRRLHKLIIKTKFCCPRRTRRCRHHTHIVDSSTDDSDREMTTVRWHCREGKQCASCTTRKTPLWRDAEDGTPLCNACGIRYKKYRIRCVGCWYVPRKVNKSYQICLNCGDHVQHTSHAKKALLNGDR